MHPFRIHPCNEEEAQVDILAVCKAPPTLCSAELCAGAVAALRSRLLHSAHAQTQHREQKSGVIQDSAHLGKPG